MEHKKFTGMIVKVEDDVYVGIISEMPGVMTHGKSVKEVMKCLPIALKLMLDYNKKQSEKRWNLSYGTDIIEKSIPLCN